MREELALSVTVDGQAHFGLYAVESEMMTAWIPSVGSRTCWLEGREPSKVAKLLLQEVSGLMLIIREWAHKLIDRAALSVSGRVFCVVFGLLFLYYSVPAILVSVENQHRERPKQR